MRTLIQLTFLGLRILDLEKVGEIGSSLYLNVQLDRLRAFVPNQ